MHPRVKHTGGSNSPLYTVFLSCVLRIRQYTNLPPFAGCTCHFSSVYFQFVDNTFTTLQVCICTSIEFLDLIKPPNYQTIKSSVKPSIHQPNYQLVKPSIHQAIKLSTAQPVFCFTCWKASGKRLESHALIHPLTVSRYPQDHIVKIIFSRSWWLQLHLPLIMVRPPHFKYSFP